MVKGLFVSGQRLIAVAMAVVSLNCYGDEVSLFVSKNGNDKNAGTKDAPFATLKRAAVEIRKIKKGKELNKPVTVYVREGVYEMPKTLTLGPADSGSKENPIVYRAFEKEKVVLSGGRTINNFKPYRDGIYQADVKGMGLSSLDIPWEPFFKLVPGFELSCNGKTMTLARWPNHKPDDIRGGEWSYTLGTPKGSKWGAVFKYYGDAPAKWKHPEKAMVYFFPRYNYLANDTKLKEVDAEKKEMCLTHRPTYPFSVGERYYVRNVFEELDAPGEWYYDKDTEKIYFMPPTSIEKSKVQVSFLESIILMRNVSNVMFRGFVLENCRKNAVLVIGGKNNTIAACVLRNIGLTAINISGGHGHVITGNDLYDLTSGGITCKGGNRKTLTPCDFRIDNNNIHHFGMLKRTYSRGIYIKKDSVGIRVSHNLIYDAPHTAIYYSGNDHLIEYNDIFNVCLQTADCGAIYSGRDFAALNNIVRYNKLHDLDGYGRIRASVKSGIIQYCSHEQIRAIYCDSGGPGEIYGNIFYRVGDLAVTHGACNSRVENNIFVSNMMGIGIKRRMENEMHNKAMYKGHLSCRAQNERNLAKWPLKESPWKERFPILSKPWSDPAWKNNRFVNNVVSSWNPQAEYIAVRYSTYPSFTIDKNVYWNFGKPVVFDIAFLEKIPVGKPLKYDVLSWKTWRKSGFDKDSIIANPCFVDPANDNFQLRDDSPAYKLGFKKIPADKIGLYKDPLRASWPVKVKVNKSTAMGQIYTVKIPELVTPPIGYSVYMSEKPVTIDGKLDNSEWSDVSNHYLLAQEDPEGKVGLPFRSKVWIKRDNDYLYIGVENPVDEKQGIRPGPVWGLNGSVEIAIRNLSLGPDSPILVLRGTADGTKMAYDHINVKKRKPAIVKLFFDNDKINDIVSKTQYGAKIVSPGLWTAEWKIPLKELGVNGKSSADLAFNISVCRPAEISLQTSFLSWRSTGGWTFLLDNTSVLNLKDSNIKTAKK